MSKQTEAKIRESLCANNYIDLFFSNNIISILNKGKYIFGGPTSKNSFEMFSDYFDPREPLRESFQYEGLLLEINPTQIRILESGFTYKSGKECESTEPDGLTTSQREIFIFSRPKTGQIVVNTRFVKNYYGYNLVGDRMISSLTLDTAGKLEQYLMYELKEQCFGRKSNTFEQRRRELEAINDCFPDIAEQTNEGVIKNYGATHIYTTGEFAGKRTGYIIECPQSNVKGQTTNLAFYSGIPMRKEIKNIDQVLVKKQIESKNGYQPFEPDKRMLGTTRELIRKEIFQKRYF